MITVAATPANMYRAFYLSSQLGLTIDDRIQARLSELKCGVTLPNFAFTLKDFQAEGVAYLEAHDGRCILADDMGLGKTCQVMAFAHKMQKFPMLVVCLNSLKFNWRNEICAMTGAQYKINIVGKNYNKKALTRFSARFQNVTYTKAPIPNQDIYISNFNSMKKLVEIFEGMNLKYVAIDESHKIKNQDAQRTGAVLRLVNGEEMVKINGKRIIKKVGKGIFSVTFMSGTPFVNRPKELWTTVNTVGRHLRQFQTFGRFGYRYCGPTTDSFGTKFDGASNLDELNKLLSDNIMLRRLKANVLKELPPKQYRNIALDFDRREYDIAEAAFDGKIDWRKGIEAMVDMGSNAPKSNIEIVAINKLNELAARAKMPAAIEWIQEFTEDGTKLVVFAHNRDVVDFIQAELEKDLDYKGNVGKIYGGMSDEEQDDVKTRFQNDPLMRVIIVSIMAGSVGLTLTAAANVAFIQFPWSAAEFDQAVDRIYRIGQNSDVTVWNLIASDTIEEYRIEIMNHKRSIFDKTFDGV